MRNLDELLRQARQLVAPDAIHASSLGTEHVRYVYDDGSKWDGGFGSTELLIPDYWTLRKRSAQLFENNLYARGIVRRLITNEINTGLQLEATPEEIILGKPRDSLADWSEQVETLFSIWGSDAELCDHTETRTFGMLQAAVRLESLVNGDLLAVLRQDQRTRMTRLQTVSGEDVQTPIGMLLRAPSGNEVRHGVEIDSTGRQVGYWVRQRDGSSKRVPAIGEKTGRRIAWLVYGNDRRLDDVRGKPLLASVLQSLREIDRFRDSVQRKALINSIIAGFIKRADQGSRPLTMGASRKGVDTVADETGKPRRLNVLESLPGVYMETLEPGEEPVTYQVNANGDGFKDFQDAIIGGIAWHFEIPPENLTLHFNSSFSASQAANNEFKIYLNRVRTQFGAEFCQPIYIDWLISQVLLEQIDAPGFIDAWRDWRKQFTFGAWVSSDWAGQVKPAVDMSKLVRAYKEAIGEGLITRSRASRELYGLKYSRVAQQLARENLQLQEAREPLLPEPTNAPDPDSGSNNEELIDGSDK